MKKLYQQMYLNILYLIAFISIGLFSFFFYQQMTEVKKSNDLVLHSHNVLEKLTILMSDVNKTESKLRGYFILHDEKYLNEYITTKNIMFKDISDINNLTIDNRAIQIKLKELILTIQKRFQIADQMLEVRKNHSLEYTLNLAKKNVFIITQASQLSQKINNLINEIIKDETILLKNRNNVAVDHFSKTSLFVIYGNLICAILMFICFVLLNRQLIFRFIAERKSEASKKDLAKLAYYDTITGLGNRSLLLIELDKIITLSNQNNKKFALIFIDIDNFKNINDSFGHAVGDNLLNEFANLLKSNFINDMIFRISGDEFAIIINNIINNDDIIPLITSMLEKTTRPIIITHHQLFVTGSFGISVYPYDGIDAKSLLKNADIAMYRAKKMGKNNYQFCNSQITMEVEKQALLEQQLHRAVLEKEFSLMYQPKLSLSTGEITGVEALIRWTSSTNEIIYPDKFINLAESNGLIVPMGEWILRTVCTQGVIWLEMGVPFKCIAINISIREINMPNFVLRVKKILEETNFNPNLLEFEITESILMTNTDKNLSSLREIEDLGIRITIDDFGTGYSSLSYLHQLSIHKLKIDQSFVKKIIHDNDNSTIINAIITMAHSLDIQVIAEGVETVTQLNFLKKYHCDEAQGYYFSCALPAEQLQSFIIQHRDSNCHFTHV